MVGERIWGFFCGTCKHSDAMSVRNFFNKWGNRFQWGDNGPGAPRNELNNVNNSRPVNQKITKKIHAYTV